MWEQPTDRHCGGCGREKNPRTAEFEIEKKRSSTPDQVREFIAETIGSDRASDSEAGRTETGHKEKNLYPCPDLSCEEHLRVRG